MSHIVYSSPRFRLELHSKSDVLSKSSVIPVRQPADKHPAGIQKKKKSWIPGQARNDKEKSFLILNSPILFRYGAPNQND
jgi:hypothetical protein